MPAKPDVALAQLRRELVGRDVYAYGTVAIACPPAWQHLYSQSTPLRIIDVEPEQGTLTLSAMTPKGVGPYGPSFETNDAVRIVFAPPRAKPIGENVRVGGIAGPCPALDLAAFQIPLTFSFTPPAPGMLGDTIAVGMPRGEVIWRIGYPWELGSRQKLLRENVWSYGTGLAYHTVTFAHDRVVAVSRPSNL